MHSAAEASGGFDVSPKKVLLAVVHIPVEESPC